MANINVRKQLERISDDLAKVSHHIALYGGIETRDARIIDNTATEMAEVAAMIATEARKKMGDTSASRLTKDVRKALGFTKP